MTNAPERTLGHLKAVRKGLEPSTSGVTGRHSNQLNYRTRLVASVKADANISTFFGLANYFFKKLIFALKNPPGTALQHISVSGIDYN